MSEANTRQRPDHEIRVAGGISVAVWRRTETKDDGSEVPRFSISLNKRYKDNDGHWRDSSTFFPNDLPRLRLAIDKAFEYVTLKESQNRGDSEAA